MNDSILIESLLVNISRKTSLNPQDFVDFIRLFGNPEGLLGLEPVLINLKEIVCETGTSTHHKKTLSMIKRVVSELAPADQKDSFFTNFPKLQKANFEGLKGASAAYSALGHRPNSDDYFPQYKQLLSHFLDIYLSSGEESRQQLAETTIKSACVAIRDLSEEKNVGILSRLPSQRISLKEYLGCLEEYETKSEIPSYKDLLRLFRSSLGTRKKSEKDSRPTKTKKGPVASGSKLPGPEEEKKRTTRPTKGAKRTKRVNRNYQYASRKKAVGKRNAITRRNQNLSCDKTELSLNDLAVLMGVLESSELFNLADGGVAREVKAILATMLWTGRDLKNALDFKICQYPPKKTDYHYLCWSDTEKYWRFYSPGPFIKNKPEGILSQCVPVVESINIPLNQHVITVIKSFLANRKVKNQGAPALFTMDFNEARGLCQSLLSRLKSLEDSEATLVNISGFIERYMSRIGGCEAALSALILGHRKSKKDQEANAECFLPNDRSMIKLHYTTASSDVLKNIYQHVTSELETLCRGTDSVQEQINLPLDKCDYLGTPFRPNRDVIRKLVSDLKESIVVNQNKRQLSTEETIAFHQIYLAYTTSLVNLCTSMRAVTESSLPESHLDSKTGFAVICDKDDGTKQSSRRVWIPPSVADHLIYFKEHMHALYNSLHREIPDLYRLFSDNFPGTGNVYLYIDEQKKVSLMGPGTLEDYLEKNFNFFLSANWSRHYLRSELIETDCPNEVVNAFLGHSETGQEPWSRFSAMHPADFQSILFHHLQIILKRDGWLAMKGLRVGK